MRRDPLFYQQIQHMVTPYGLKIISMHYHIIN
uniref:Uncharacterized protein n=1 Tax=Myoviridae sp. ctCo31 TaxID=2825053 RepID=A0A8S5UML1_9CAUD|nr:MAG TPA: hypothetical protein [Myoviridae sp. ctCo31]